MDQLASIFPNMKGAADLLVVPTCQRSEVDLVTTGEKADEEKDRLLESVSARSAALGRLGKRGPAGGRPGLPAPCVLPPSISAAARRAPALSAKPTEGLLRAAHAAPHACADAAHPTPEPPPCSRSLWTGPSQCAVACRPPATGVTT
jgi:hypothetical protein